MKRALAVSVGARLWSAVLSLLAVPIYVRHIGVEAYGIVGFFASVQALVSFMDFGLGATLTRDLARLSRDASNLVRSRNTIRTFEFTYAAIASGIALVLAITAPYIAAHWITVDSLTPGQAAQAMALGAVALACQWPANLYGCGLAGLHKQVELGVATALLTFVRVSLTIAVVLLDGSLTAFFAAQIVAALFQSFVLRALLWRHMGKEQRRPSVVWSILRDSREFAGGMTRITITAIVLMQMDKVILSHALRMKDFGIYVVCGALASGLYMAISPVFNILFPRFSALISDREESALVEQYRLGGEVLALLVIPAAALIALFASPILFVWTGDAELARHGGIVLALLTIGNALNGLMNVPYALQLASGWTTLAFRINVLTIIILAPATWYFASNFGGVGGASVWCALNVVAIVVTPQLMHRRLLRDEKARWFVRSVIVPAVVATTIGFVFRQFDFAEQSRFSALGFIAMFWVVMTLGTLAVLPEMKSYVHAYIRRSSRGGPA